MKTDNIMAKNLMEKIQNKTAVLGVVGLGYVGLPLAVEKAKSGYQVIGFDVQDKKVEMVNQGHNYIGDVVDAELAQLVKEGRLTATSDFAAAARCDCVAICVPTPLDKYYQPDISYVESSAKAVAEHCKAGSLIVLESTTYPGTTEEIIQPLLEKQGYQVGKDIFLAFSPERVDPGNKQYKTKNTPKVVGGVTPSAPRSPRPFIPTCWKGRSSRLPAPKWRKWRRSWKTPSGTSISPWQTKWRCCASA